MRPPASTTSLNPSIAVSRCFAAYDSGSLKEVLQ
jgi:hypothetical protein